ncbi:furostanol glycoside 26-O-beta-glucosidase-like [Musa acuminata AAA Group]|uniref:furostanol glycoside 26-O-beta-glucosidase-like n=1 Tax=Musa acuminata AAA Group TaxID=214697 RepID=UPI0031CEF7B8
MALLCVPLNKGTLGSLGLPMVSQYGWVSGVGKARVQPCHGRRTLSPILCSVQGNGNVAVKPPATLPAHVTLGRSSFPPDFAFGAASAAYQVEGAWNEGGREPSIWDTFTHVHPDKIADKKNGDVATDSYRRYKDDIEIMKNMGVDSYRFSISWSRILPKGTIEGGINQEGIKYYNNLINELLKNGIKPYVTLFHWDVPQALEDAYGGFLSSKIVNDFKNFASVCFQNFGDRVKHWITLNEPWSFSSMGYSLGKHAPARCTPVLGCPVVGDSLKEPYIVTHNLILAHAAAATLYKKEFKETQKGEVGITLVSMWYVPYSASHQDIEAANRAIDFMLGWYMDPLVYGDYPFIMRALVQDRLPFFTDDEAEMIKGSYDFIGINYYTSRYAKATPMSPNYTPILSITDSYAEQLDSKDNVPIGELQGSWIYVYPRGMKELLLHMKNRYQNPNIYITENGTCEVDIPKQPLDEALEDQFRIDYLSCHLAEVRQAIRQGVCVKGYFAWALTDNFEWENGYTERFGLNYIDYDNNLNRHLKSSAHWYTRFLHS